MEGWGISPLVAFTFFGHETPEKGGSNRIFRAEVRGTREFGDHLDAGLGLGLLNWIFTGSGGTVELNNGTATTLFGNPSETTTARMLYLGATAGLRAGPFRWENSLFMIGALASRRSVSFASQLAYGFY